MLANTTRSDLGKYRSKSINKKLNIIALDNEAATLTALSLLIKAMGHEIVTFSSSQEALKCLEKNHFDIALIDYRIPGAVNGVNIVHEINKISSATRCFLVTGDNSINSQSEDFTIINKPLTNKKLKQIFQHVEMLN